MKNFIFPLACIMMLFSCTPEKDTESIPPNTQPELRGLTADALVGSWEDSESIGWITNQNPTGKKPLYQLNGDGTYTISYRFTEIGVIPPSGAWTFDAEQDMVTFSPANNGNILGNYYWVIDEYQPSDMTLFSAVEPTYTIDGQQPPPTYNHLHLYKK